MIRIVKKDAKKFIVDDDELVEDFRGGLRSIEDTVLLDKNWRPEDYQSNPYHNDAIKIGRFAESDPAVAKDNRLLTREEIFEAGFQACLEAMEKI